MERRTLGYGHVLQGVGWLRQSMKDLRIAWQHPVVDVFKPAQGAVPTRAAEPRLARTFAVVEVRRPTADSVTLVFANDPAAPLRFEAGQFVTLHAPIDGAIVRRSYSMCSDPAAEATFAITVKRVPNGVVSNALNAGAAAGDRFVIEGPHGRFVLADSGPGRRVFVAGGSGITPIMAMLRAHCADPDAGHALLLYGNRRIEDAIFAAELAALEASTDRLTVRHLLETPTDAVPAPFGRMSPEILAELLPADVEATFFVCGPEPMMDAVTDHLAASGVPPERVRVERFAPRRKVVARGVTAIHRIELRRSGQEVRASSMRTLLEASMATDHPINSSCQLGGCGSCKVRVLSGEVEMEEPNCLSDGERAEGYRLACISRPCSDVVLDA